MSPQTIWLASFPKSGNTWVRALLAALDLGQQTRLGALQSGPIASARSPLSRWLAIPTSDLSIQEIAGLRPLADAALDAQLAEPRFRKIHDGLFTGVDSAPIIPPAATRGAVYIVRDPRDIAASYAEHMGTTLADAVEVLGGRPIRRSQLPGGGVQLPVRTGSWSEHLASWLDQTLFPVLLVRYEDLHANPAGELRRIVAFAGLDADDTTIARAVAASAFAQLAAAEAEEPFAERARSEVRFFRRGVAGGWRDELPDGLARRIEADHREAMLRLGYV